MKNKIALATAAMVAGSSLSTAEIVINDFLSFEGFIDMSYFYSHTEDSGDKQSDNSFGIDQVEISWLFDFDPVTAQIDLEYDGDTSDEDTNDGIVEQAFATYHFDNGGAITAGRFASVLGFEAFEPTGLYQYSVAYGSFTDGPGVPGYNQGVKYTYETDTSFFSIALQDSVTNFTDGNLGGDSTSGPNSVPGGFGVEFSGAFDLGNGLSAFAGGAYGDSDTLGEYWVANVYGTFETGAWIFAAELWLTETEPEPGFGSGTETLAGLLMANFAYSDAASITARLSYYDYEEDGGSSSDGVYYTLAHGYAFTDNLFLVTEISILDEDVGGSDVEAIESAIELLFTF